MAETPGAVLDRPPAPDPSGETSGVDSVPTLELPAVASGAEASDPAVEVIDLATVPYTDKPIDAGTEDAVLVDDDGNEIPNVAPDEAIGDSLLHDFEASREAIVSQDTGPEGDLQKRHEQIRALERQTLEKAGISVGDDNTIAVERGGDKGVLKLTGVKVLENSDGEKQIFVSANEGGIDWILPLADLQSWQSSSDVSSPTGPDAANPSSSASSSASGGSSPATGGARPIPPRPSRPTGSASSTPPTRNIDTGSTTRTSSPSGDTSDTTDSDRVLRNMAPLGPESHAAPSGTTEALWRETKKLMEMDPKSPEAKALKRQFGDLRDVNMNLETGMVTDLEGNQHSARDLAHSMLYVRETRETAEAARKNPVRRALGRVALRLSGGSDGGDTETRTGGRFEGLRRRRDALYARAAGNSRGTDSDLDDDSHPDASASNN